MQPKPNLSSRYIRIVLWILSVGVLLALNLTVAAQPLKIGFILKTMQEERYQTDKTQFITRAESLGAEVLFDSSSNSGDVQTEQFDAMLNAGCQVIVLQPADTATAGAMVKKAHLRSVKVVGYDSMLVNGPLDIMVMQDSWSVGKLQGQAMLQWLQQKKNKIEGNVALIMGQPGDSNAEAMSSGVLEIIAQNPGLKLIAKQSHLDWSPDLARETARSLLLNYNNQIDAFICNNSGLALGVVMALEMEGIADAKNIFVAGSDADLANIKFVVQGKQSVEIWKKIKPLAYKAAEIAVVLAKNPLQSATEVPDAQGYKLINNGFMDVPTLITPVVLITKDNIDSTIIAEKFFTREQVYGKGK
jgi:D-xylose transport system substrate-binding protein